MTPGFVGFLLFLGALSLLWKRQSHNGFGLRLVVWFVLSFASAILLLFALFSLWWPPADHWSVLWSGAALAVLVFIAIANASDAEWKP